MFTVCDDGKFVSENFVKNIPLCYHTVWLDTPDRVQIEHLHVRFSVGPCQCVFEHHEHVARLSRPSSETSTVYCSDDVSWIELGSQGAPVVNVLLRERMVTLLSKWASSLNTISMTSPESIRPVTTPTCSAVDRRDAVTSIVWSTMTHLVSKPDRFHLPGRRRC